MPDPQPEMRCGEEPTLSPRLPHQKPQTRAHPSSAIVCGTHGAAPLVSRSSDHEGRPKMHPNNLERPLGDRVSERVDRALLVRLAPPRGQQLYKRQPAEMLVDPASGGGYDTRLAYPARGLRPSLWLGLAPVVASWFAGSNTSGTPIGNSLPGRLEAIGVALADGPADGVGRWPGVNPACLRAAVFVPGVAALSRGEDLSRLHMRWPLAPMGRLLACMHVMVVAGRGARSAATSPLSEPSPAQQPAA
jgi:hypothetical protein